MCNKRQARHTSSGLSPTRIAVAGLVFALSQPLLQGCAPAVVTGVAVGASVIHDRRDATTVVDDQRIELQAMADLFNDPKIGNRSRISVTSYNYVVLLTGQAETDEVRRLSADKVSRLSKVRRVINEVSIAPPASLARQSEDTLITSRVKLDLTRIDLPGFDPLRVKVVTEDGIVYLMGLVTEEEADAAVEKARYVPGVEKVVKVFEYVKPSSAGT